MNRGLLVLLVGLFGVALVAGVSFVKIGQAGMGTGDVSLDDPDESWWPTNASDRVNEAGDQINLKATFPSMEYGKVTFSLSSSQYPGYCMNGGRTADYDLKFAQVNEQESEGFEWVLGDDDPQTSNDEHKITVKWSTNAKTSVSVKIKRNQ